MDNLIAADDMRAACRGLAETLGLERLGTANMTRALSPWWRATRIARQAAHRAAAGSPPIARDPEAAYRAVRLWQQAFRASLHNARYGPLEVYRGPESGAALVTEPLSGIGVTFKPDAVIDSTGRSKDRPTFFDGRISDNEDIAVAEDFRGLGIGRWVYLRGAQLAFPQMRWPISHGMRPEQSVQRVRAWLHTVDPYTWAPVHLAGRRASCPRCGATSPDGTEENWAHISPDEWRFPHTRIQWQAST
ncbi:hypothetical protein [Mycobacteroides abscessus]|uniref:hypothetical protein n=1 Tax=Mycobacteroides abscessus TaxID=36809 RepID=UPI0009A72495|nr:hypothetical protein [Mycobacteroides abscessus]SLH39252.1 Uncharacterised protein [Mycobacteroides abscessus subsp. massiliense]